MKGLKDFLYDKNDILIALAILIVAALLIIWRMDVIMDYPHTLAEETGTVDTTEDSAAGEQSDTAGGEEDSGSASDDGSSETTLWSNGVLSRDVTVTIQSGSLTSAVQCLIDAELFDSYDQFLQICQAAGYDPDDIKATTFTFDAGMTQTDIARIVTN
ncbi:MAG: hypothetical protein ACI4LA_09855 [Emergencia sp.]